MNSLFTDEFSRVLAMGVGSLGCLAAKLGVENREECTGVAWSAAHVNSSELIATGLEQKLFLQATGAFAVRNLARSLHENPFLDNLSHGRDAVILCGELSDDLTPPLIDALSVVLRERRVPVFALLLEPFSPNGEVDVNVLETARERLSASVPCAVFLNAGLETVSAGIAVKRLRKMAAERLMNAAECLAAPLNAHNEHAPRLLALRGRRRAAFCAAPNALAAFELALRSFDESARECIDAAILQNSTELSFREMSAIQRRMNEAGVSAALASSTKPPLSGRAECLLLSGNKGAANVVRLDAAMSGAGASFH
ncbi:MAG TPA: hypothetical protein VKX17_05155 [Planctomycetota bacterium]|nr:hypothetical protein [Planctomycetota bacterium]